ncbi:transposase [Allobaculum mucilyticum]|uniref:transposase n=1 Tax=Allobaculum mucilyticum TaxID=2834459 RepID=UPI001F619D53|nr:transposase [Allobaculum mucilyticum]UNT95952.1 transposase [Allobaculum mucilyticum]
MDAADRLQVILADLNRSQVKELNAFGQTVVNWFREIVNSFEIVKTEYVVDKKNGKARRKDHRLTSSMIENRNKLVKQIKNNANGYTNWKRFRNRVLYVLNRPAFRLEPFEKEDKGK